MSTSSSRKQFRYGNYHQYYGYRNKGCYDARLSCMKKEWFESKDILDIGCNAGHLTLSIAKDFSPNSIVGMDIDKELINMAKKNVRHYIDNDILSDDFPLSLALSYGPVAQKLDPKYRYSPGNFPFNVQFIHGNYILCSDEALEWQEPFFDTIVCFSLTKWVHLNWGDVGVKRLFNRAFMHLRPGGLFLLEAQAYESYAKRKRISEETFKNFKEIKFYPEMFNEYLLKEVGFQSCELVDTPGHSSKASSTLTTGNSSFVSNMLVARCQDDNRGLLPQSSYYPERFYAKCSLARCLTCPRAKPTEISSDAPSTFCRVFNCFSRPIYLFTKGNVPSHEKRNHVFYDSDSELCNYSDVEQFSD